jgi:ATP-dependent protease Clp ATPase subunit
MDYYKYDEIKSHFDDFLNNNLEYLKENETDYIDDLHHMAFNEDYYIIGRYEAKQWLGDQVFNVIDIIKQYEQDNFGKVNTDLSEPEKVVNMYAYIVGEYVVNDYINSLEKQKATA